MRKTNWLYVTFICLCLTLLSGCPATNQSAGALDESLSEFRKALRWGYYDAAVSYIKKRDSNKPVRDRAYVENIRITSYEYGGRRFLEDESTTEILAIISFYDVNRGSVVTIHEKQIWWLDPELNRWFLDGDFPDFSSALY